MPKTLANPTEIRAKALRLYPQAIQAWLEDDDTFFPHSLRISLAIPKSTSHPEVVRWTEQLRQASKETLGHGFTLTWESIKKRQYGDNHYPTSVSINSLEDLLRLTGKRTEFKTIQNATTQLRSRLPELSPWITTNWKKLLGLAPNLDDLITVTEFLRDNPRPGCYIRQLPIAVSTKLVDKHQSVLSSWFDLVLDPKHIQPSTEKRDFEIRYGFLRPQPHIKLRLLDGSLQSELGLPWTELSLPASSMNQIPAIGLNVLFVENSISLLSLPDIPRSIALGGLGNDLSQYCKIQWLTDQKLFYWGDLDVEGLDILSRFRWHFPGATSFLMDADTLSEFRHLCIPGKARPASSDLAHLNQPERSAIELCQADNLRLEQEHIPQASVLSALDQLHLT